MQHTCPSLTRFRSAHVSAAGREPVTRPYRPLSLSFSPPFHHTVWACTHTDTRDSRIPSLHHLTCCCSPTLIPQLGALALAPPHPTAPRSRPAASGARAAAGRTRARRLSAPAPGGAAIRRRARQRGKLDRYASDPVTPKGTEVRRMLECLGRGALGVV